MIYLESISVSIPHISSVISVHSVISVNSIISLPASASSSTSSSEASATSETIPSVSTKTSSPIIHSVHSSGGRSYSNVNEVSDDKLAIVKCLVVIWSLKNKFEINFITSIFNFFSPSEMQLLFQHLWFDILDSV